VSETAKHKFTLDGEDLASSKKVHLLSGPQKTFELPAGTFSFRVTME